MNADDVKKKYLEQLESQLNVSSKELAGWRPVKTLEYDEFRKEILPPHVTAYEGWCNGIEKLFKFAPNPKAREKLAEAIRIAHLQVTPEGVYTLSYSIPFVLLFLSIIVFAVVPLIAKTPIPLFLLFVGMLMSLLATIPLQKYPFFLATSWRLRSSNQMVICIFYLVTYMRQTSNIERAMDFAAEHLDPPLALDIKKILWDVENDRFDTLNEALDDYLKTWKKYSDEFIDSLHLIQSSLLEGDEGRRLDLLDKSLDTMLDGTYEKMLHYAQNLKNPITTLHMLGIILPVLGLVILPLAVSFIEGVQWYHLVVLYNIILPLLVYLLAKSILATRPSGYGDTDIRESIESLRKYRKVVLKIGGAEIKISPAFIAATLGFILLFIGFLPLILHAGGAKDFCWDFTQNPWTCSDEDAKLELCKQTFCAWEYRTVNDKLIGPFGLVASVLSIFIPLGLGLGLGLYYHLRSQNVIKIREEAKKLEDEFATALYQLGNRLGDGLPAEIAFPKVAELMEDTVSGNFFAQVALNMEKLGMGLVPAIFDPKQGAISAFPSKIIDSSMKVLIESVQKGPLVAAQAMNNVARYIKEIHRVNERLKDLLSDIISSMKQQISFLTPMIAGVVVGITSMITFILGKLQLQSAELAGTVEGAAGIQELLQIGVGIPTFHFQAMVGVYVVQITWILTIMANAIENGEDKLGERSELGKNLIRTTITYCLIGLGVLLVFQVIAGTIISGTLT